MGRGHPTRMTALCMLTCRLRLLCTQQLSMQWHNQTSPLMVWRRLLLHQTNDTTEQGCGCSEQHSPAHQSVAAGAQ